MVVQELPQREVAAEEFQSTAVFQWLSKSKIVNKILSLATKAVSYQAQEKTHKPVQAKLMEVAAQVRLMEAAPTKRIIWKVNK